MAGARPHDERAAPQPARVDRPRQREDARALVVLRPGIDARGGSHADRRRWRDVRDRVVERGLRARRENRQADLEVRSGGAGRVGTQRLLRRRESRRRRLGRLRLRRNPRRTARLARCRDGCGELGRADDRPQPALHDHRRAARREGKGRDRQRRRGARRARLRDRLRREDRRAGLAFLHGARRSVEALRASGDGEGREDLDGRVVEGRRRRHRVGLDGLRSRSRSALRRHRQRLTVEPHRRAVRVAATICTCLRSSRCAPTPASSRGTTRPRPATTGTTPPCSRSCSRSSRSAARSAGC